MAPKPERLATWWLRWEDLNWPSLDNMDKIKRRADALAEANATGAVIFGTHFRWDYLPYFTILHDYLGAVAQALHDRGLKLIDHHSVNLVHRYDTPEEMRHVILHSGPHLPFSPSREAAACWEYQGQKLNDWRMMDVVTGDVLYFPQYAAEGFCHRNPDFIKAYIHYAKKLVEDTGIDGLMADDTVHYRHMRSCGCAHCRAALRQKAGIDLPPVEDQSFWGNWENPAWRDWVDLRFESNAIFQTALKEALPEDFLLMSCGGASATPNALLMGTDARQFLKGTNYTNFEMCGNTPPYKHDPVTVNRSIGFNMVSASHHQAAAREKGVRCFGTGYGFTEPSANIIWAVNKVLGGDCWFSTLKDRLGLPERILKTLPEEADAVGKAFTFEKEHPQLFEGEQVCQVGVYFSYETRNHSFYGVLGDGMCKDYSTTLTTLFEAGISLRTLFSFPEDVQMCPVVLLPGVYRMTREEKEAMDCYLQKGGKVIAVGPTALEDCKNTWSIPDRPACSPLDFFSTVRDGVWMKLPGWLEQTKLPCKEENTWQEPRIGLYYNPCRITDPSVAQSVLDLCRKHGRAMPLTLTESVGYLTTLFESRDGMILHMLAADYDVDIDHELDDMRIHRSRVNYIVKADPIGVSPSVKLQSDLIPQVFTPFNGEQSQVQAGNGQVEITLPKNCAYALLYFPKNT